jgi:hypothetical protein
MPTASHIILYPQGKFLIVLSRCPICRLSDHAAVLPDCCAYGDMDMQEDARSRLLYDIIGAAITVAPWEFDPGKNK